jgi:hypothetical protein
MDSPRGRNHRFLLGETDIMNQREALDLVNEAMAAFAKHANKRISCRFCEIFGHNREISFTCFFDREPIGSFEFTSDRELNSETVHTFALQAAAEANEKFPAKVSK